MPIISKIYILDIIMDKLMNKEHNYDTIYSPLVHGIDKFQGTIVPCANKYNNRQNIQKHVPHKKNIVICESLFTLLHMPSNINLSKRQFHFNKKLCNCCTKILGRPKRQTTTNNKIPLATRQIKAEPTKQKTTAQIKAEPTKQKPASTKSIFSLNRKKKAQKISTVKIIKPDQKMKLCECIFIAVIMTFISIVLFTSN